MAPMGFNKEYKDWDDCISKNRDKDDPERYCGWIKRETEDNNSFDHKLIIKMYNELKQKYPTFSERELLEEVFSRIETDFIKDSFHPTAESGYPSWGDKFSKRKKKICDNCGQWKVIFYHTKNGKKICKECYNKRRRNYLNKYDLDTNIHNHIDSFHNFLPQKVIDFIEYKPCTLGNCLESISIIHDILRYDEMPGSKIPTGETHLQKYLKKIQKAYELRKTGHISRTYSLMNTETGAIVEAEILENLENYNKQLTPVSSSNVKGVGQFGHELIVQFYPNKKIPQRTYRYQFETPEHAEEAYRSLIDSGSPGRWIWQNIRGHTAGERITSTKLGPSLKPPGQGLPTIGGTTASLVDYKISSRVPITRAKKFDKIVKQLRRQTPNPITDPNTGTRIESLLGVKKELRELKTRNWRRSGLPYDFVYIGNINDVNILTEDSMQSCVQYYVNKKKKDKKEATEICIKILSANKKRKSSGSSQRNRKQLSEEETSRTRKEREKDIIDLEKIMEGIWDQFLDELRKNKEIWARASIERAKDILKHFQAKWNLTVEERTYPKALIKEMEEKFKSVYTKQKKKKKLPKIKVEAKLIYKPIGVNYKEKELDPSKVNFHKDFHIGDHFSFILFKKGTNHKIGHAYFIVEMMADLEGKKHKGAYLSVLELIDRDLRHQGIMLRRVAPMLLDWIDRNNIPIEGCASALTRDTDQIKLEHFYQKLGGKLKGGSTFYRPPQTKRFEKMKKKEKEEKIQKKALQLFLTAGDMKEEEIIIKFPENIFIVDNETFYYDEENNIFYELKFKKKGEQK